MLVPQAATVMSACLMSQLLQFQLRGVGLLRDKEQEKIDSSVVVYNFVHIITFNIIARIGRAVLLIIFYLPTIVDWGKSLSLLSGIHIVFARATGRPLFPLTTKVRRPESDSLIYLF